VEKKFIKKITEPDHMLDSKSICDLLEEILKNHEDVLVPVKELREILEKKYNIHSVSYDQMIHFIKEDNRFDFFSIPDYIYEDESIPSEMLATEKHKIEEMGFFGGSRVKLKSVNLEMDKIVEILQRKVDGMMNVLINIWNNRPKTDQNLEDKLLDVLARAQKIQREVKKVTDSDKIHDLLEYLKNNEK
jgi:hypothetical protein